MKHGINLVGQLVVDYVKSIASYPSPGMLSHIGSIQQAVGGCVTNTAIDLATIDPAIPLHTVGRVGDDDAGRYVKTCLQRAGISTGSIITSPSMPTGFTDVMNAEDTGERTFFHCHGANAEFSPADVSPADLPYDLMHAGYILLLDAFDEADPEYGTVMARFLHDVQAAGIATSIDVVSGQGGLFREKVIPALRYCDYAIMNEIEACSATGLAPRHADGSLHMENLIRTLEQFMAMGVRRRAVIHCPEAGLCMDAETGLTVVPSFRLPAGYIKGSVGAGDAFAAGCLYAIHHGKDPEWMLRFAAAAAAANLSAPDSVSGMKPAAELEVMMNTWETNTL